MENHICRWIRSFMRHFPSGRRKITNESMRTTVTARYLMSSAAKSSTDYEKAIQRFEAFIEESSLYLEEYQEELINIVGAKKETVIRKQTMMQLLCV